MDDTDIFNCYRCMKEWEIHTYLIKYETRKCNLCHRPMCKMCMKDEKNKRICFVCELHPEKRECWQCGWEPYGSSYQRLVYLHRHLRKFHPSNYKKKYYPSKQDKYYNYPC